MLAHFLHQCFALIVYAYGAVAMTPLVAYYLHPKKVARELDRHAKKIATGVKVLAVIHVAAIPGTEGIVLTLVLIVAEVTPHVMKKYHGIVFDD